MNYISEASKFMYDDDYIVEATYITFSDIAKIFGSRGKKPEKPIDPRKAENEYGAGIYAAAPMLMKPWGTTPFMRGFIPVIKEAIRKIRFQKLPITKENVINNLNKLTGIERETYRFLMSLTIAGFDKIISELQ